MRRALADWLNNRGIQAAEASDRPRAIRSYELARRVDPKWSLPWYNLGLQTKYEHRWQDSMAYNRRASELNPADEAAWWNLAIAATALHDWSEARRAWRGFGIDLPAAGGEVILPPQTACVRLNPEQQGEVVFGERIDPARMAILNVPLPESGHRFHDIVLNDGASNGKRTVDGVDVPVFDELCLWRASAYATFQVALDVPSEAAQQKLIEMCNQRHLGIEDWSTVRWICAQCSHGNPGPHDCKAGDPTHPRRAFALAGESQSEVVAVLGEWSVATGGDFFDVEMVVRSGE